MPEREPPRAARVFGANHWYARRVDVSVRRGSDGRFAVTLVADEQDVSLRLSASEIRALVTSAHWSVRGTMRAGESSGAPVFWASDGDQATLLIGHDDGTADAITVPFTIVDRIVRAALASEVPVPVVQSYEPPPPDDDLVGRLRAAVASVPDLHEAYLVARRTAWPEGERLELGVVARAAGRSGSPRSESLRAALAPFSPPSASAPLGWVAYSSAPVPDDVRGAAIRLA
jgi:hypothetical protein